MKKYISILLAGVLLVALFSMSTFTVSAGLENKTFGKYTYVVVDDMATIIDVKTDISGEVVIPSSIEGYPVTGIDERSFDKCDQIVTLKIPAAVTYIGDTAFERCTSLTKFIVGFGNTAFCTRDGVLFSKDTTTLVCYPPNKQDKVFAIPDGVEEVDTMAFAYVPHLEQITVADSVKSVGDQAFYQCSGLKQITFGTGLTKIGEEAFAQCTALTSFTIPNSVKRLGMAAFSECSNLSKVTVGRGLNRITDTLFLKCTALKTVELPDNVTAISGSAFSGCSALESITIPKNVTEIGSYAFYRCEALKTVLYTGSEAERETVVIGAKNEALANVAQWQYDAPSAEPSPADTSVGPQPIAGHDSNVIKAWVIIGGIMAVLAAALVLVIVALVKGIKQHK